MRSISWDDAIRRIASGEDAEAVLDEKLAAETSDFVNYLRSIGRPDLAESHLARVREIDSGVYGARNTWHSISVAQRQALAEAAEHGGRLDRVGKEYRHKGARPDRPIYVATVRNLCSRALMAWDGGAFDPEAAAVITERGVFILKRGGSAG